MTRFLSESLQAKEPEFRLSLRGLETASGQPSHDIHLTNEISQAVKTKIKSLGLDPDNTTAEELFETLKERLKEDDKRLTKNLRTLAASKVSAEADPIDGVKLALKSLSTTKAYALKSSRLKSLLRSLSPKKTTKALGYRSVDSMLKRESPNLVAAAAWLSESPSWQKRLIDSYKKLTPSDFEDREVDLLYPKNSHWQKIAASRPSNLISFNELGVIVFLPFKNHDLAPGQLTSLAALALHQLNEIRATSAYLKLTQVKSGFGGRVAGVALDEPRLQSNFLGQALPFKLLQHYYKHMESTLKAELEPYLELEDMAYRSIERSLSLIEPNFNFWNDSSYLGLVDGHKPVSLNILDSALNLVNSRSFDKRLAHYYQDSLWHELLLRYFKHKPVNQAVIGELQPEVARAEVSV